MTNTEDNKELHSIAVSDKNLAIRQYEADKKFYALRNVRDILEDSTYINLESNINKIIDVHINLKAKDRYKADRKLNSTEYKNKVRKYISERLEGVLSNTRDTLKIMVGTQINVDLQKGIIGTTNRSAAQVIANREKDIDKLENELQYLDPSIDEYTKIDMHPFTYNSMTHPVLHNVTNEAMIANTYSYKKWIRDFPNNQLIDVDDIDFSKKVYLWMKWDCLHKYDAGDNFIKSFKDQLSRYYGIDDKNIMVMLSDVNEYVSRTEDGAIYYILKQVKEAK